MSQKYKFHNPEGLYFITPTLVGWVDLFSRQVYREIVLESIRFCQVNQGLIIHAYVIMTNHIHMIISGKEGVDLKKVTQNWKKFTAKRFREEISQSRDWMEQIFRQFGRKSGQEMQFWVHGNHQVELWSAEVIRQKLRYIHENPVRAGWVEEETMWRYSSASNYAFSKGLLDVELLDI